MAGYIPTDKPRNTAGIGIKTSLNGHYRETVPEKMERRAAKKYGAKYILHILPILKGR